MNPTQVNNNPVATAQSQLNDIKAQAANIVKLAQKKDPKIKISEANAEMIGLPKVDIPTQKKTKPRPSELDMVGSTPTPKTGLDTAREAILSQVGEEDRATIDEILRVATGLQTERGKQLESEFDTLSSRRLDLAQRSKDRTLTGNRLMQEQRIPELEAELESIRSEADVLSAQRNAAIQAEERRTGVSTSAMSGNVNRINRDFDLQQANLAIRELASVGKINAATKLIESKLDIQFGDLEAETELVKAQIEAILPMLNREDAKVAEQRLLLNDIVKSEITDARQAAKDLELFKLQSYQNAQLNGASPAILSQIMSSTSREDVASVGGTFVQDPMQLLNMQNIKSQMATDALRRTQIQAEINAMTNPVDVSTMIQKAVTDADPVTVKQSLATLLGSDKIAPATKARISPTLAVLNSVDELANTNIEGKFTGVGIAGRIKEGIKGLFNRKAPEAITNAQNIEAINLKVQQWASGAALTDAQTKQVERFTPRLNDSDKTVKTKLNGLYNFMLNQAETELLTEGVNVQFPGVNLFEIADLYEKASPEQKQLIEQTYFSK